MNTQRLSLNVHTEFKDNLLFTLDYREKNAVAAASSKNHCLATTKVDLLTRKACIETVRLYKAETNQKSGSFDEEGLYRDSLTTQS